ncbi:A/G-specific adenine glycosylase [Serinicoccus hydrothermalis]|uniref:Adenine DNA glycosylase n=1 Tax=Serinicoccus hydrothermalis TaxID=1758689 RepID=A0A1B1NBM0_9MICO|nr:A/G-specific adenine glycosylase [Serinicoccus hydrothermalis]ANS78838.1 A/G-specific adenine glycosylase [Serinicoccus hydrothermalis]
MRATDVAALHDSVLTWYAAHRRDLPWRAPHRTPWGVLVSEVMLQQTPVVRVLPVWERWMDAWPTPADLAAEPSGTAVREWGRLGYPRRALRLHAAATAIRDLHGGEVPSDEETLRTLPGIGDYTAAAVAAFAFGRRATVVDTNVRRVHARALTGTALPAPSLTRAEVALATSLLPQDDAEAATWSVAVMELGALVCTARAPRCGECPVAGRCAWLRAGSPAHDGPARRGQAWAGTDRQCRGTLLQVLREVDGPVPGETLRAAWPGRGAARDASHELQRDRCLDALVAEGLVEPLAGDRYRLPGT